MGDNSYIPCITYRKNATMAKRKNTFFRLNCGNSAKRNKFVGKLDTVIDNYW